jgi:hypothetical protein
LEDYVLASMQRGQDGQGRRCQVAPTQLEGGSAAIWLMTGTRISH